MPRLTAMPNKNKRPPLLIKVLTLFGKSEFNEVYLFENDRVSLRGLMESDGKKYSIYVNPMADVIHTVIHELLHVLYPDWSEQYIECQSTRLLNLLSHDEIIELYHQYLERRILPGKTK